MIANQTYIESSNVLCNVRNGSVTALGRVASHTGQEHCRATKDCPTQ